MTPDDEDTLAAQRLLSTTALAAFGLNGQFLTLADELAAPADLTATWWQVLGAVIDTALPVVAIARTMGITRQSVQRTADLLVQRGLAAYEPNPAHRRSKLVTPTVAGREAMARIGPGHAAAARALMAEIGAERWTAIVDDLAVLRAALTAISTASN